MTDNEVIERLKKENDEFKKVEEEHRLLDEQIAAIDRKLYLTTDEEMEKRKLQKIKLIKKDRMSEFIRDYKRNHLN